jgi:hypothetical protein
MKSVPAWRLALGFGALLIIYGSLAMAWLVAGDAYATAYRAVVESACRVGLGHRAVVVLRPAAPGAAADSVLAVRSHQRLVWGETAHSVRLTAYLPTIEVVALVLVTPLPWRRRLRALGLALGGVHLFIASRFGLALAHFFNGHDPWSLYAAGPAASRALAAAFELLVVSPTPSFVVPVIVWIAAAFRRGDWERLAAAGTRLSASQSQLPRIHL